MSESTDGARAPEGPSGIGGWLLLPVAHVALYAVALLAGFVRLARQLFGGGTDDGPAPLIRGDQAAFAGACLLAAAFAAWCLARALRRRRDAPRLMMAFFFLMLAASGLNRDVMLRLGAPPTSIAALLALLGATLGIAVWVPYLLTARRVRNTFVA